jgi:hypothetical protein
MSWKNLIRWMSGISGAAAFLLAHPSTAAAQCIMCYMSASSSGERGAQALRLGILVLAIPTLLTFAGVFLLAYRRRNPVVWEEDSHGPALLEDEPYPPLSAEQQSHSPSVF